MCVKIECRVTATQLRGTLWNPAASQDLSEMYENCTLPAGRATCHSLKLSSRCA